MKLNFIQFDNARKIRIPSVDEELAEDIGIQLEDGSVGYWKNGKGKGSYKIQVYGDITEDKHYLLNFVKPLKERLYRIKVFTNENNVAGTLFITIYSKNLVYFYKYLGFPIGPKYNIKIPKFVFLNKRLEIACLRGLMDADGSLAFCKGDHRKYSNPVIHFTTKSKPLARQACKILEDLEFTYSIDFDNRQHDKRTNKTYVKNNIYISGKRSLEKWMNVIGFNNIARISRYFVYKKLGFCPPHTNLKQRLNILGK